MTPPRTPLSLEALHASAYIVAVFTALAEHRGHVGHASATLRAAGLISSPTDDAARKWLDRYLAEIDGARAYLRTMHPRSEGQPRKIRQSGGCAPEGGK